ncbi:bacteriorhodopsin [Halobacillus kuroshimensis]|uniref:bacteriorhodopsin n=1 Tax=Halobacillus kuroshimensis TaxID=302481 RepID=UPI00041BCD3E|nr:bacteriorhodopsin [Halobacillus kuroshimensis]
MSRFDIVMHYSYSAIMFIGAVTFFIWSQKPRGVSKGEYIIAMIIPLWSGTAYLSIALGQGVLQEPDQTIYFARYLDWVVTTPLLLLALALTAMFYEPKKDKALIGGLITADVFMILTGLIADFSNDTLKYVWYGLGIAALLIVLYIIWYPLRKMADKSGDGLKRHYRRMAAYLTSFWVLYPTAWVLGPSGVGAFEEVMEITAFIVLPILSKLGFTLLDLKGLRELRTPGVDA